MKGIMKFIVYLICATLFLVGSNAYARGCRTAVCAPVAVVKVKEVITPVVAAVPVAVQTVFQPVFVPVFQYQYNPGPICATTVVAPNSYGAAQGYGGYQQMQQHQQPTYGANNLGKDSIKALAKALLEEMNRDAESPSSDDGPPAVAFGNQAPPHQIAPPNHGTPTLNPFSVMANKCATCHTGSSSQKGFVMFFAPGQPNPGMDKSKIYEEVASGRMPKNQGNPSNPNRLSVVEQQSILAWAQGR